MIVEKNGEYRNDLLKNLKVKIKVPKHTDEQKGRENKKVSFEYDGKYGMGYDGCGSHTHDD